MQTAVTHQKNLPWLNLIFLSLLFFTSSRFDLFYSVNGPPVITGLASNRSGDALKAVSILLLCLWSFHSLWRHRNYSVRLQPLRAILIGSYCVWCGLSFLWTDDRGLTGSRLFLLAATMFIAFALAFRFSNREIVFLVFVFGAASNFVGLCAEICLGTFRPWNAQYRFSGLWHPNTHGLALSLLVLAGLALWRSERDHKTWIGFVTAFGFVLLLLTRSRTSVGSTIFVAALTTLLLAGAKTRWAGILLIAIAFTLGGYISINRPDSLPADSVTMGRDDGGEASTLTNRIPLWRDCVPYWEEHFWKGYGYGGFWTADRIITITAPEEVAWNPELIKYVREGSFLPDAHNMYLEACIETGLIGATLFVATLFCTILVAGFRTVTLKNQFSAFIFSVFLWLCIEGMLEAITFQPCLPFLIAPLMLAKTAFVSQDRVQKALDSTTPMFMPASAAKEKTYA